MLGGAQPTDQCSNKCASMDSHEAASYSVSSGENSHVSGQMQCKNCSQSTVNQDTQGSQDLMVCEHCGWSSEVTFSNATQEWCPPSASLYSIDGPTRQGRFYEPKNYQRTKERSFVKLLREMASKVNLPEHETTLCEQEGKDLLSKGQFGTIMKRTTAGLVFIALQRHSPTVSFKEVAEKLDINVKSLGKVVKDLKKQPSISKPKVELTAEERIQAAMDKLPSSIPSDTRIKAKKIAIDLKQLCQDKKVQGNYVSGLSADCAFVVVSLEAVEKKKVMAKVMDEYTKNIQATSQSFRTRLWEVRTMLLTLAEDVPSIATKVKSKEITSRNIQKYVPIIVQNKAFLMINPERERLEVSPETAVSAEYASAFLSEGLCSHREDESDSNLSDLDDDIQQYIASDKEVARKKRLQSQ